MIVAFTYLTSGMNSQFSALMEQEVAQIVKVTDNPKTCSIPIHMHSAV
jgi:hypothetical protein